MPTIRVTLFSNDPAASWKLARAIAAIGAKTYTIELVDAGRLAPKPKAAKGNGADHAPAPRAARNGGLVYTDTGSIDIPASLKRLDTTEHAIRAATFPRSNPRSRIKCALARIAVVAHKRKAAEATAKK
jgi:hypothetical protein